MSDDLTRFKHVLATIALEHPEMNMRDGIKLALQLEDEIAHADELLTVAPAAALSVKDEYAIAAWLWDNKGSHKIVSIAGPYGGAVVYKIDDFWDYVLAGPSKKIQAIKEARGLTGAGLREAKYAVELIERHLPGRPPRTLTGGAV